MNTLWSRKAIDDLNSLRTYLSEQNPHAAEQAVLRILDEIERLLPNNPHMGRPGRVPGTRELVVTGTPYIVPYRVQADVIHILRVYHAARRWPDTFG